MKRIVFILSLCLILFISSVRASLPLSGKVIIIDPGHGSKDMGTSHNKILEKEINMQISNILERELVKNGATVILTREGDYDLSSPNAKHRKKSDFNNRIDFINKSNANLYISIHINYLSDSSYSGAQVFYEENNKELASVIQKHLNTISYPRSIKKMPPVYMYDKLKIDGVLIECGFISNSYERRKLTTTNYQQTLAEAITKGIIEYYK